MGAMVMSANLKIKFDVFIEIRGRSTRAAVYGVILHVEPSPEGKDVAGFNSTVMNDES